MYDKRFGLTRRPFPATPDDALYYPATAHEQALADLVRGVRHDEGLMLLTAGPGAGKSLLGQILPARLDGGAAAEEVGGQTGAGAKSEPGTIVSSYIAHAIEPGRRGLLQAVLFDMQLPYEEGSEQTLRLRLVDRLLKNCAEGKRTLVVMDEAHNLGPEHLEELRSLGNLEAGGKRAFQVVLLGQPALLEILKKPELAALNQRLAVRCRIEALAADEAYDYLLHHVRLAGGKPESVFDEAALEVLSRGTQGIPRLLNQAAHQALHLADAADLNQVDAEAALEALALLGLAPASEEEAETEEAEAEGPDAAEAEAAENGSVVRLVEGTRRTA